jgi:fatty-acyl-CoA synthase
VTGTALEATDISWPQYSRPEDVETVEAVPLADRGIPQSTLAVLRRAAARWPDRVAISVLPDAARWREAVDTTYAELLADASRIANLLGSLGVAQGAPVGIISPNCAQLVPVMFGIQAAGVAVPLNGGLSVDHLATLLERTGTRVLFAAGPDLDPALWSKTQDLVHRDLLDVVLALEPSVPPSEPADLPRSPACRISYLRTAWAGQPTELDHEPGADDLAAIFHTGGTTGVPKLAAHTHRNQTADAWMIAADSTLQAGDTVLAALPLFHVNALHVTMLAPVLKGQRVVWAGPLGYRDPALYPEIWRIVEHFGITTMSAVPTVYAVLAGCPVDADISTLRHAIVGASALPHGVRTSFEENTGVPLLEGYGLTEGTCASARSFLSAPRPGSVGKRLPYQPMRVVRTAGDGSWQDVAPGERGTLLIGGPTVFAGYVVDHDRAGFRLDALGKVRDGWLDTGDLARLDADGFVHLAGRAKDLIIRGGHNIDPAAIEAVLLSHPEVADAAAVGRPDPRAGEVPVAYVTLVPGSTLTGPELRTWVTRTDLEPAARPRIVTIREALPVTDVGKPYKLALRADAAAVAVVEALGRHPGIVDVSGSVVDGSVTVTVTTDPSADGGGVRAELDRFALTTRVVVA